MVGIDFEGTLEMLNSKIGVAFSRGQDSQIVQGVGQCSGIAGMKLQNALETFAGIAGLLLLQVRTAESVEGFGAFRVVLEGLLEIKLSLFEVATIEKDEAQGKIVTRKVEGLV